MGCHSTVMGGQAVMATARTLPGSSLCLLVLILLLPMCLLYTAPGQRESVPCPLSSCRSSAEALTAHLTELNNKFTTGQGHVPKSPHIPKCICLRVTGLFPKTPHYSIALWEVTEVGLCY